jgi:hypothetical protein
VTHRRASHGRLLWLAPFLVTLAAAFPAAAGAATPATACGAIPASNPCYNTLPAIQAPAGQPPSEVTSPQVGRFIQVTKGDWSPPQQFYTYQWVWDCNAATPASGSPSTHATYQIADGDAGHTLCVLVTTAGVQVMTAPTGTVGLGTPLDQTAPSISGNTQDGQTLTADPGTWRGSSGITFTYQWKRCNGAGGLCGKPFTSPSPSPTYVLQDADLGRTMQVLVTATNAAGSTTAGAKIATDIVRPSNTAAPKIAGTAQEGKTLTVSHGSWVPSNAKLSYQWEACSASGSGCSAIGGASSPTYVLSAADVGHTVVVEEFATASGSLGPVTSVPAVSNATGVVRAASGTSSPPPGGTGNPPSGNGSGTGSGASKLTSHQIRSLLAHVLAVHGKLSAVLRHGGYSVAFAAPSSGRLAITWYYTPKHGRKFAVVAATFTFHRKGTVRIKLVLTAKGRTLLTGASRVKLTAKASFTPTGRGTTSTSKALTLKA